jgi:hypothetical protein
MKAVKVGQKLGYKLQKMTRPDMHWQADRQAGRIQTNMRS